MSYSWKAIHALLMLVFLAVIVSAISEGLFMVGGFAITTFVSMKQWAEWRMLYEQDIEAVQNEQ